MAATYDKNKDYTALIRQAVSNGDLNAAANYEQSLNAKIAGEGLSYAPQHNYDQYLGTNPTANTYDKDIDYTAAINKALASGDKSSAKGLEAQLNAKIIGEGLNYNTTNRFSSETEKPTYTSQYSDQIDALVSKILNGTYDDFRNSADYQSLASEYAAKGKKAMQDTVADVSARTGGLASSYATTAGAQANNDYMQQLQDVAREMYSDQRSDQYNEASLLSNLDNSDYAKYQDQLSQYDTEQSTAYSKAQDTASAKETKAETLAQYGDFSGYKDLGYSDAEIAAMTAAYKAQLAASAAKSSGSGSGSGSSKITSAIIDKSNEFSADGDTTGLENYLNSLVYAGKLSESDADYLYDTYAHQKSTKTNTASSNQIPTTLKSGMSRNLWIIAVDPARDKSMVATRISTAYNAGAISEDEADSLLSILEARS
ncbi:MAG: hypothetical protein VB058_05740 [Oscillospiraceae bacterium]|nr:hypothetical protein [Oscillospiraceae bacterium]